MFAARLGIGQITVCDKDVFEESNLNRQLFSTIYTLGQSKANVTREKLLDVNPLIKIVAEECEINAQNALALIEGHDLVIDAMDNVKTRLVLESACEAAGMPLIFGAVSRWCGEVSAVFPGDKTVSKLYKNYDEEKTPSVLAVSAAAISGLQLTEAVNVLLDRAKLRKKLLVFDLSDYSLEVLGLE
jgi:Dinucleotide-utilizing enzymes involved in molybdopterin and thiamine biosynthesis family 2